MADAVLVSIGVSPARGQDLEGRDQVEAVPEVGLVGDRFGSERKSQKATPSKGQVTLIEVEALEAVTRDYGFPLQHAETRRNLLTRGVPLNHLVGREFTVGGVRLVGTELCEPCGYLERRLGRPVQEALRHRGGLRAQVLEGGTLRPGDPVRW